MSAPADRRVHPRLPLRPPLRMLVQFRLHDLEEFMREHAMNISVGGMFLRTTEPHPRDSMIYLQFRLADGAKLIEGLGRVVHVNPPDHAAPGMGIEFVNLDAESREFIDRLIQERMAELE